MDYANIFSLNQAMKLLRNTSINKHAIEFVNSKKLSSKSIDAKNLVA